MAGKVVVIGVEEGGGEFEKCGIPRATSGGGGGGGGGGRFWILQKKGGFG